MRTIATTRMSSKGQVVIPEKVRLELRLKPGVEFAVFGEGDNVMLKRISPPSPEEFREMLAEASRWAKRVGLKRSDITKAIKKVRAQERRERRH